MILAKSDSGEPPTREAAQALLENYYFNPKRYDLAKVGRYKINKKLGLVEPFDQQVLTVDDIVAAIRFVVALHEGVETLPTPSALHGKPPKSQPRRNSLPLHTTASAAAKPAAPPRQRFASHTAGRKYSAQ